MIKRSSKKSDEHDFAVTTFRVVREATGQAQTERGRSKASQHKVKNPHAVALGRLGGKKGGPARAKKLTPEQRREIGRKAAMIRWHT